MVEPNLTDESFDTAIMDETMAKEVLGPEGGRARPKQWRLYWRRLLKRPAALVGTIVFCIFLFLAVFGPWVAPYDYQEQSAKLRLATPVAHPSVRHRPVRARHLQPRHRRDAQHLPDRRPRHAHRRRHRHGHRARRRLHGRRRRRGDHALTRRAAELPVAAAGDGAARRGGAVQPQRRARRRRPLHPDGRARRAQHGARPQEQGVRRGRARARREAQLHPLPGDPAELAAAAAGRGEHALLVLHLPGRLARLPRARRPAAVARLGAADRRGASNFFQIAPWVLLFPACIIAAARDLHEPHVATGCARSCCPAAGGTEVATTMQGPAPSGAAAAAPRAVFEIEGLHIDYTTELGVLHAVRDVSLTVHEHESFGLVGESGSGKSTLAMGSIRYLASNGKVTDGSVRLNGVGAARAAGQAAPRAVGIEHRRGLPEPAERAEPVHRHRQAARRGGAPAPGHGRERRQGSRRRDAHQGRHAGPRSGDEALPAPALRRHAAALRHRHGADDQPVAAHHGRADDGPGRHHPGRRPRPRRRAQAGVRLGDPLHHARPRRDHQDLRPRGRDVRRRVHGAGRPARALHAAAAPVHARPARLRAALRPHAGEALAGDHPRGDPARGRAAAGLHLRAALRVRARRPAPGAAAARRGRRRITSRPACAGASCRRRPSTCARRPRPSARPAPRLRRPACWSRRRTPRCTSRRPRASSAPSTASTSRCASARRSAWSARAAAARPPSPARSSGSRPPPAGTSRCAASPCRAPPASGRGRRCERSRWCSRTRTRRSTRRARWATRSCARSRCSRASSREEAKRRAQDLLRSVSLPVSYFDRLPHELSGGEKQRVAIARAFAAEPELILCDEPISSLDVSVQGSLMNLLMQLQVEKQTSYLFISHDLSAVQHLSDAIAVVYLGPRHGDRRRDARCSRRRSIRTRRRCSRPCRCPTRTSSRSPSGWAARSPAPCTCPPAAASTRAARAFSATSA